MSRPDTRPPKPTAAELDLLRVIWRQGPSTAREAHLALQVERPEVQPATVLRLLQVMHGKGLVVRDESKRSHVYAAAHARDALQTNLLDELIQKVFSGSGKALVMAALEGHVSEGERDEIRRLLEETEVPPADQGGTGHA
ncbi:BlaI/MecI/CopY family transcriptional regulator [Pseudoxanthomonas daejeonensis]|uniref:BlaI/MecI/CopY family transcriptional regulator n=1 Tax=Pseudoxanthomonas daejeonensis TaxID=266062 RepID=UPI001F53E477|nr:BlaI/MecI/CopY family transcriptional regulator [Pseudoxanthomonas daejeonensis]UNK57252.1 BlaI/MecI/CopY family transcriptional regulator [Pseudoxanthomonas daejeonensis]